MKDKIESRETKEETMKKKAGENGYLKEKIKGTKIYSTEEQHVKKEEKRKFKRTTKRGKKNITEIEIKKEHVNKIKLRKKTEIKEGAQKEKIKRGALMDEKKGYWTVLVK